MNCKVDGCTKPNYSKGYCNTHYNRQLRTGTTDLLIIKREGNCQECGKAQIAARGICWACYARNRRKELAMGRPLKW